jgi:hypothetical protein
MIRVRNRLSLLLSLLVVLASLSSCSSQCVPCQALSSGPTVQNVGFELCASEGPEATQEESTCLDIFLAYIVEEI